MKRQFFPPTLQRMEKSIPPLLMTKQNRHKLNTPPPLARPKKRGRKKGAISNRSLRKTTALPKSFTSTKDKSHIKYHKNNPHHQCGQRNNRNQQQLGK